jgi:acid stress-induced BolA-like protein IbaG/YrbA
MGPCVLPLTFVAICLEVKMRVSDITATDVANYLRIDDPNEVELSEINMFMDSAKASILSMTGLTQEEVDALDDMVHPYLLLISDQFDNRNGHIENKQTVQNQSIMETIRRHSVNYL